MKHLTTACLSLLLVTVSAHAQQTAATTTRANETSLNASTRSKDASAMQGAYAMLMQIVNDGTRDSMVNVQQFKIYTDRHFMYAHALPGDSLAYYGIGTYSMNNGQLTEYPFFTSAEGAVQDTVAIRITKLGNGYVQVINFPPDSLGRQNVLTEEYGDVSSEHASPLDGAWKQTKNTFIGTDGKTTNRTDITQFKVFQSGRFMWASTYPDSATQKTASAFGYGTFEMTGRNEFRERTTNSTYRTTLIGKPVSVKVKFTGKDVYEQTINWPEGKSVETYERLK